MRLFSILSMSLLVAAASGQYVGEGPVTVNAPTPNPALGATAMGVAQVQQVLLVPHATLASGVYYCAATVIKTARTDQDLQSGIFDSNTGVYTKNNDIDVHNTTGVEFALGISDDLKVAVWDAPIGVLFATRAGTTGAFGLALPVVGVLGTYVDPNFARINGRLTILWVSGATTLSAADFDPLTGIATNARVIANRTGASGIIHSPTPLNDASGATRGLVFNESLGTWTTMTSGVDNNTPNFQFLKRGTNWLANGDCNGGTITVAEAVGATYTSPVQVGIAALTGSTIPSTGGIANLTMYMPSKNSGTPYSGTVLVGTLASSGTAIGGIVVGNFSLNFAGFIALPVIPFNNVAGSASYSFPVGAFPIGTKLATQAAILDTTNSKIYLSNTAQLLVN